MPVPNRHRPCMQIGPQRLSYANTLNPNVQLRRAGRVADHQPRMLSRPCATPTTAPAAPNPARRPRAASARTVALTCARNGVSPAP